MKQNKISEYDQTHLTLMDHNGGTELHVSGEDFETCLKMAEIWLEADPEHHRATMRTTHQVISNLTLPT